MRRKKLGKQAEYNPRPTRIDHWLNAAAQRSGRQELREKVSTWLERADTVGDLVALSKGVDTALATVLPLDQMGITVDQAQPDDENRSAFAALESRPGQPIRLRLQPQLYFTMKNQRYRQGAFLSWRSVYWNLQCATVAEAIAVKDALTSFFKALMVLDPGHVQMVLDTAVKLRVESAPSINGGSSQQQQTVT